MQTCIVNSLGTGKSRMVHEAATKIITVPMCLRIKGSQGFVSCAFRFSSLTCLRRCLSGFPPPDIHLRDWFQSLAGADSNRQAMVAKKLHDFMYSVLTVLLKCLKDIESEVKSGECRDYLVISS
jgi:hypothetical protein